MSHEVLKSAIAAVTDVLVAGLLSVGIVALVKLIFFFGRGSQRLESINEHVKDMKVSMQKTATDTAEILKEHAEQLANHQTDIAVLKERTGWLGQADGVSP